MRPIAADVAWFVCLLVTTVSCAKTAELIKMSFGVWPRIGSENDIYQLAHQSPMEGAILEASRGQL